MICFLISLSVGFAESEVHFTEYGLNGIYDGKWEGITSQGKNISFNISGDVITYLKIKYQAVCYECRFTEEVGFSGLNIPIVDNQFEYDLFFDGLLISGLFDNNTASGTFNKYFDYYCGACYTTGTWSASKIIEIHSETITINLNQGWNLLSIPLNLINNSANYLFNNTNFSIYGYNNSWFVPDEIDNKLGYWLKINESFNLTLIGNEIEDKSISLNEGWNLVGYPSVDEISIDESELKNHSVFTYINNSWSSYVLGRTFNSLNTLKPGFGYWVKIE